MSFLTTLEFLDYGVRKMYQKMFPVKNNENYGKWKRQIFAPCSGHEISMECYCEKYKNLTDTPENQRKFTCVNG